MGTSQNKVLKIFRNLLIYMSLSAIVSCAGLDPRNVQVDLAKEPPYPQKTIYNEILSRLGDMSEIYESKPLKIQCLAIIDDTGSSLAGKAEIPHDITEMLKSSLNSIGGRVVYIPNNPNYIANQINLNLRNSLDDITVPNVIITGGITEFDRGLETKGKNLDLSAEETLAERPIGLDYSTAQKNSITSITLDFNLIDYITMAGLPRMQTTNSIKVHKAVSERELAFTLLGPSFGFKGTIKKIQGRHEAVRLLVQMGVIQIVGRYLKLPYWRLVPNAQPDPEVIDALRTDYRVMSLSQRITAIQKLLILNGYVVPVTGVLDTQTKVALQKLDNRFDPYREIINADLFLNLYFSVPIGLPAMNVSETNPASNSKSRQNMVGSIDDQINAPSVETIVEALTQNSTTGQSALRGAAGKRNLDHVDPDKQFEIDLLIPFGLNQFRISDKAIPYLHRLGQAMADSRLRGSVFEIQGHTCDLGREDYNLWLSQKRAEAVKNHLVRHFGFSPDQLRAIGYGMKRPKWSNDTEANRARNRRVTIVNKLKKFQKAIVRPILKVDAKYLRGGKEMEIRPGTALNSRDNYALAFTADSACYVYVFQFDSQNTVTQLFPNSDFNLENNPIAPNKNHRVPTAGQGWLFLDENSGEEELIVLAYPEPLPDPLKVALSLTGHYESKLFPFLDDVETYTTRGPKGVRQAPDDILFIWRNKFAHVD